MVGVLPCAGMGTRLGMGTKGLVKIKNKYLIEYPLLNMFELGIRKVIIIQNEKDIENVLGNNWNGMPLEYVTQKEKKGSAHAISLAEDLVSGDDMLIILGDIIFKGDLYPMKSAFKGMKTDLLVGMQKVENKEEIKKNFGLDYTKQFIEKPKDVSNLKSLIGLGIYMATKELFKAIKKNPVGELTDALNYVEERDWYILKGYYMNVNTKEDFKKIK
jgi:glucose-1-phosphate thymidylyltransferase